MTDISILILALLVPSIGGLLAFGFTWWSFRQRGYEPDLDDELEQDMRDFELFLNDRSWP